MLAVITLHIIMGVGVGGVTPQDTEYIQFNNLCAGGNK